MALTVYVTEDFGALPIEKRFKRRQIFQHSGIRQLDSTEAHWRMEERDAHHALNLPRPDPTFLEKAWESLKVNWYYFRLFLSELIGPGEPPKTVVLQVARFRQANVVERRKIIEELWQELAEEREDDSKPEQVLRITEPRAEFLVEKS